MSLTEKAMLARLTITQWSARKMDKRVTEEVRVNHDASADAGRYNKLLIAQEAIKTVQAVATAARETHYRLTLPWRDDGARILPAKAFFDYSKSMRDSEAEFNRAVAEFLAEYPVLVSDARHRLNGMFSENDYPSADKLRARFSWTISIDPLPTGEDFRVTIGDDETARIRAEIDARTRQALADGMRDAWQRLYDAVKHAADKLADADAIFRDSLIGNIRDLCGLLPVLNFADDARLEAMRANIETKLAGLDCDGLRRSPMYRHKAAQDAQAIARDLSTAMADQTADKSADLAAFMGGAS